jgi:hypothetical protein
VQKNKNRGVITNTDVINPFTAYFGPDRPSTSDSSGIFKL